MINKTTSLVFYFLSIAVVAGQQSDSLQLTEDKDQPISMRSFEQKLSDKYQGEEFNYEVQNEEAQNLIQRALQWFFQTLRENLGINISPEAMQILEYIIYVLMGGLVIYLLVRFLIGEKISSIFSNPSTGTINVNLSEEHIENIDLNGLLKAALEQKDYRLAVRYHYLKALKTLSQNEIIDWHYEKTNSDYQREIRIPSLQAVFKEVSYLYDYIWYGEQVIDATGYSTAEAKFFVLEQKLPDKNG